jgi:SnoaL-like domain
MRSSLAAARDIVLTALVGVLVVMGVARQAATADRESSSVRLQRLEDREAIRRLIMEDTIGPSRGTSGATGTRGANLHVFTNETIDVRGDTAIGLTKWLFVGSTADNQPQPLLLGHYVDTFVRENGEWKFQRRLAYGDIPANEPKASN